MYMYSSSYFYYHPGAIQHFQFTHFPESFPFHMHVWPLDLILISSFPYDFRRSWSDEDKGHNESSLQTALGPRQRSPKKSRVDILSRFRVIASPNPHSLGYDYVTPPPRSRSQLATNNGSRATKLMSEFEHNPTTGSGIMAHRILEYFNFAALLRNPKVTVKVELYTFEMATPRTIDSHNF